jgi:YHS domain-containing protein
LTARLAAHAVGGQILCSDSIARAIDGSAGVTPRPIGTRYFKNVTHAVPLFELVRVSEQPVTTITDPVCRMQVTIEGAAATIVHEGIMYQFCSTECARLFSDAPACIVRAVAGRYASYWTNDVRRERRRRRNAPAAAATPTTISEATIASWGNPPT